MEIISIVLFNLAFYWRTVDFKLIVDDRAHAKWILENNGFGKFEGMGLLRKLAGNIKYRFYGCGTLVRPDKDGKWVVNPKLEHMFQLFLHTLTCVLIYITFKPITSESVSLCAALLYSIHPAINQTSIWLNGRRYIINIIIVLLMIIIGPWGLLLYPMTVLFQVNAIFSPLIFGWAGVLTIPVFLLLGWGSINETIKGRLRQISNSDQKIFRLKKLIIVIKIYGMYFFHMIIPKRILFTYKDLYYWGLTKEGNEDAYRADGRLFIGLVAIGLTILGLLHFNGSLLWLFVFMVLSTLQWCGIISVTQIFSDRYAALPCVLMVLFISVLSHQYLGHNAYIVLLGLFVYYMDGMNVAMSMYKDIWAFYDYNIFYAPEIPRNREFKATRLMFENRDPIGAWEVIKRGLEINPKDMKMNMMAAQCMEIMQDKPMVIKYLREAWRNCYIGQEGLLRGFQKSLFGGLDIEEEVEKIRNKESKLERKLREVVLKVWEAIDIEKTKT
jgi:hypothetical protein